MGIEKTAENYIRRHRLIGAGDLVCVGLSGGADSVALLLALKKIRDSRDPEPFGLAAVHINHNLRGEAADDDCRFVRDLCGRMEIPLKTYSCPVAEYADEKKIGLEEAGREVRHEKFFLAAREFAEENGMRASQVKIALAHHADDQAETVLFRAARGTSLAGLAGIRPMVVMDGLTLIRPLLPVTRAEIEAWLLARKQRWRTDATNADESYARNAIRGTVLPCLKEKINHRSALHLAQAAEDMAAADEYLRGQAKEIEGCLVRTDPSDGSVSITDQLLSYPEILQNYILMDALERAAGRRKDLGREQLTELKDLFAETAGKRRDLPYGVCAHREYDRVVLDGMRREKVFKSVTETSYERSIPGEGDRKSGNFRIGDTDIRWEIRDLVPASIPQNRYTKVLDYDKINYNLVMRFRRNGDRIVVNAKGGSRKLKDYLIDRKIPRRFRDRIPLLASGSSVFWVVGHRISEDCKVTGDTRRVLVITAKGPDDGDSMERNDRGTDGEPAEMT
uniref:tRNA lysidine(34) synthetase TilS n=1 Tax=Eubacterium cellulosolvens TaxID=29322 RepID=UPI00048A25EA|nr:tRNA lysidine(34) synthetase TilS [[Eubacterium] cellulosolvens]